MDASAELLIYGFPSSSATRQMPSIPVDKCQPYSDSLLYCPAGKDFSEELWVRNVYPPIQMEAMSSKEAALCDVYLHLMLNRFNPHLAELQPRVTIVVGIFVLCFIIGICGNSSVLTIIRGVMRERRHRSKGAGDIAIFYIAALCVVDFLMSLSLAPAIMDSVIGFWVFGTFICKLHHICGSVGRILSTFLITAMSFDRYVAVCYPHHRRLRSKKFVIGVISFLSSFAFVLLLPMITYARDKEMVLHELYATNSNNITRVRVYKCSDMMPSSVFYWFTTTTFILGYILPLTLIILFNVRLINKLYAHQRYWTSVLYAIVMSLLGLTTTDSELLLFVIYCVHLLPYFVSSTNWILYGLLNTQLLQQPNVRISLTTNIPLQQMLPEFNRHSFVQAKFIFLIKIL
ncbi:hypothetical protein WR25_26207 [Diploscapter pachys]|uniref:G-protein coupled receptors family 1 profile domain-containing protein n=1 Tax=Diploscapter pachys TaxID=2018661 RepID=A0A2A2LLW3_9BILA|nr:hypothetical protein WR25_26207 [Diploscapter pachys]